MITVGLPNYCSPIAWLAMESLCRQQTTAEWELIVYEDSDKPLGALFYSGYQERLEAAGCKKTIYLYSKDRVPLNKKWLAMGEAANPTSIGLILQASDCYSEPRRIETANAAFANGYDWVQSNFGYFYNFLTDQMMRYTGGTPTGLNMAISMSQLMDLPQHEDKWSGVDYWLFSNMKDPKVYIDTTLNWMNGVDTDGYGRISLARKNQYNNPQPPFYPAKIGINTILPADIIEYLSSYEHRF